MCNSALISRLKPITLIHIMYSFSTVIFIVIMTARQNYLFITKNCFVKMFCVFMSTFNTGKCNSANHLLRLPYLAILLGDISLLHCKLSCFLLPLLLLVPHGHHIQDILHYQNHIRKQIHIFCIYDQMI